MSFPYLGSLILKVSSLFIHHCLREFLVKLFDKLLFSLLVIYFLLQQKFLEHDFLLENLSSKAPVYIITEGSEPLSSHASLNGTLQNLQ